jgi:hypothetical protein
MAEDIKMINMNMINLFNEARLVKPNDPELLVIFYDWNEK